MYQITKIKAVNRILKPLNGSKVSSLDNPTNGIVNDIVDALEIATEKLQFENEWNFNLAGPVTLQATVDNEILVPEDWLFIKFGTWTNGSSWDLTVKNNKLWDRHNQTDNLQGSVEIIGTRMFTYDECPAIIQSAIIEKAKFELLGLNTHLSVPRIQIYSKLEGDAYRAAQKWDSEQKFGILDLSPSFRDQVKSRGTPGYWWNGG